jgi:hypothetical protein
VIHECLDCEYRGMPDKNDRCGACGSRSLIFVIAPAPPAREFVREWMMGEQPSYLEADAIARTRTTFSGRDPRPQAERFV